MNSQKIACVCQQWATARASTLSSFLNISTVTGMLINHVRFPSKRVSISQYMFCGMPRAPQSLAMRSPSELWTNRFIAFGSGKLSHALNLSTYECTMFSKSDGNICLIGRNLAGIFARLTYGFFRCGTETTPKRKKSLQKEAWKKIYVS